MFFKLLFNHILNKFQADFGRVPKYFINYFTLLFFFIYFLNKIINKKLPWKIQATKIL